jgi:hypothetical protein
LSKVIFEEVNGQIPDTILEDNVVNEVIQITSEAAVAGVEKDEDIFIIETDIKAIFEAVFRNITGFEDTLEFIYGEVIDIIYFSSFDIIFIFTGTKNDLYISGK